MTKNPRQPARKPATKFAHLRKKMQQQSGVRRAAQASESTSDGICHEPLIHDLARAVGGRRHVPGESG